MKKHAITALLAGLMFTLGAAAQQPAAKGYQFGGLAFGHDLASIWDFGEMSRTQSFGTARAMAMGGAFTSLGADLSTMSLNPAGLGMYRGNELSVTPLISMNRADRVGQVFDNGTAPADKGRGSNARNLFALGNVGVTINVMKNPNSAVTSVNFAFGMNRIADFNRSYSFSTPLSYNPEWGAIPSIADLYAHQLQFGEYGHPVFPDKGEGENNPNGRLNFNGTAYFWPAVLGYKGAMTHVKGMGDERMWERDAIGENASIRRGMDVTNSGSINEFTLAVGANIRNIVYVGASFGIQSVRKNNEVTYSEDYTYEGGRALGRNGELLAGQLEYADMWQRSELSGAGINLKLGVTVRPTKGLRLGVAFHTPTYYTLDRAYRAGIGYKLLNHENQTYYEAAEYSPTIYDEADFAWEFTSPTRLMFGASYTFGRTAILAVDYERDWYRGVRVKNAPGGNFTMAPAAFNRRIRDTFRPTNNIRAGLEIKPTQLFALRAGGGYSSSMLSDETMAYDSPMPTDSWYFSLGAGMRLGRRISLDIAYQMLTENQSQFYMFYEDVLGADGQWHPGLDSALYETAFTRHFLSLTMSYRF